MSEKKRGKVIILVAPSGSGKTTIAQRLIKYFPKIRFSVSATTRKPRPHEIDGKDYHFLSHSEFDKLVEEGAFLEYESFYNGKKYGTLKSEVEKELNNGYFCLLDIEVVGASNVKNIYKDQALAIFIKPPSIKDLRQRLLNRGTETGDTIKERLERVEYELSFENKFDVTVVNDDLNRAYKKVQHLVQTFITS